MASVSWISPPRPGGVLSRMVKTSGVNRYLPINPNLEGASSTLGFDATGALYVSRTGRRYFGGEVDGQRRPQALHVVPDALVGLCWPAVFAAIGAAVTDDGWLRTGDLARRGARGLVAFAGEALTQVPITVDYAVIFQSLEQLQAGTGLLEDGTAIGTAIATAANRLRRVPGKSHVMVLLTDGENNRGEIDPMTAARAAAAFDIKVHTIGVGSEGMAPIPIATGPFGVQYANLPVSIDEKLLREIAVTTGGRYYRATNESALDSVYREIDALEKSTVQVRRYVNYTPHYLPLLALAMILLLTEWTLRASRWGRVP